MNTISGIKSRAEERVVVGSLEIEKAPTEVTTPCMIFRLCEG